MDVWMIWAQVPGTDELWLVEAWDDDSVAGNHDGWLEALSKAEKEHGARFIRVTTASINFDKVLAAFQPTDITSIKENN